LVVVVASSASVMDIQLQLLDEQRTWQLVTSLYHDRLDTMTDSDVVVIIN